MKTHHPSYPRALQKASRLTVAILVSLSVLSTGVFANTVCSGACCMDVRKDHHVSGSGMRISMVPQPCCCTGENGMACQSLETEKYPVMAFADSAARYQSSPASVAGAAGYKKWIGDHPGRTAEPIPALPIRPASTPLFISTLALLI